MTFSRCFRLTAAVAFIASLVGCVGGPGRFVEKEAFLLRSRRVGDKKSATFSETPRIRFDFDSEDELGDFKIAEGEWRIENGQLRAVAGKRNRAILLAKCVGQPLKIEFEVTNHANPDGSIGDITVLVDSTVGKDFFQSGYSLTTGSFYNNCSTFYKKGRAIAKTEYSPLVSGKTYQVAVEIVDGHIRYWLDDEIILEAWDPTPLKMEPTRWIGIRTWNTRMDVDWLEVY